MMPEDRLPCYRAVRLFEQRTSLLSRPPVGLSTVNPFFLRPIGCQPKFLSLKAGVELMVCALLQVNSKAVAIDMWLRPVLSQTTIEAGKRLAGVMHRGPRMNWRGAGFREKKSFLLRRETLEESAPSSLQSPSHGNFSPFLSTLSP